MAFLDRIRQRGKPVNIDSSTPAAESAPLSVTGRGHVDGFLALEELNIDLQGRQGLEVFDRMYRTDSDVRQVVALVSNPLVAGTWEVQPYGGAKATDDAVADAEFAAWALFENMKPNLRGHLGEALPVLLRSGFSPFEMVWEVTEYQGEQVTVPRSLQLRLPRTIYRWKQDKWGQLEAIEQYLPVPRAQVVMGPSPAEMSNADGSPVLQQDSASQLNSGADISQRVWLPMQNLVYYRIGNEGDNWEGVSCLRPAYKHWLFKDAIERMDAIAQEKEALGTPVCYPPLGATPDQFDAMEGILQSLRTNAQGYILMPGPKATGTSSGQGFGQGWLLEYLKPGEHGTGRDPQPALKYHTDKIAAAFIAEFIRLGHSLTGGSRNVAETQSDPFLVGVEALAGHIEDILNEQLVAPLIAYNRPKAKQPPRLKMSLVDNTTLSQLADFLLKLIQVGAIIPDQALEDFLRERGDLPPADPHAVSERGSLDDTLRREILMGKNGGGGAPTGTNGPAGSSTGGSASGAKGVDNKDKATAAPATAPPASAQEALARRAVASAQLSQHLGTLSYDHPNMMRPRWRDPTVLEAHVGLDAIEDHFDNAPEHMLSATKQHIPRIARDMARSAVIGGGRKRSDEGLQDAITHTLSASYELGQSTAGDEMARQSGLAPLTLAAASGKRRGALAARARHATGEVLDAMHHAAQHSILDGHREADAQGNAERAGAAALKAAARTHSVHLFNIGREERILDVADGSDEWGVVYTAILDRNTCDHCREADDGVVRDLNDLWLEAHKPPNPECESVHSLKGNQCRCFLLPAKKTS